MESKRFDLSFLSCSLIGIAMAGCGGYSAQIHRVDGKAARDTLALVLQSWQSGTSPESWQQKVPAVVVQDKCQVKLTLQNPVKGKSEKIVTYLVGTSPVLTVFRTPVP